MFMFPSVDIVYLSNHYHLPHNEELDGSAASALRRAIAEVKQRWSFIE
jgi:hypothetical protein